MKTSPIVITVISYTHVTLAYEQVCQEKKESFYG